MLDRIDNGWLHTFMCVYEHQSFAKASEYLDTPSSNVSRHIQQLECELGSKLFYRTTRRVTPTPMGELLFSEIKEPLFNLNQSLQNITAASSSLKATIRMSAPDIPEIGDILADFLTEYTNIHLSCEHSTSIESAIKGSPDVIISFERGVLDDRDWISKPICQWESVVLASPKCIEQHGLPSTISELETLPCISSYKAFNGNPWIFNEPTTNTILRFAPKTKIDVDGGFIAKAIAIRGLGFVALPKTFCSQEVSYDQLREIKLDYPLSPLTLFIHYRAISYHSFITKRLVEFILNRIT